MPSTMFDAPIPGQSLTTEKGSSPVEFPPHFADTDTALEYIFEKLTIKKQVVRLCLLLKKGASVEFIARSILFQGFVNGKWSPDNAMLMLRIVMAMIIAIAHNAGVKTPKILNEDKTQNDFLDQFVNDEQFSGQPPVEETVEDAPQLPEFTGILGGIA